MKPNTTRILTIIFSRNLGLNFRTSLHDINNWLLLKEERIRKECYGYLESYKPTTTVDHIIISSLWFAIDYHPFVTCVESCRIKVEFESWLKFVEFSTVSQHRKAFTWMVHVLYMMSQIIQMGRTVRLVPVSSLCRPDACRGTSSTFIRSVLDLVVSNLTILEIVVLGRPPIPRRPVSHAWNR